METVRALFHDLPAACLSRLALLQPVYEVWNARINVISRKDMDAFYMHHVLHSLALLRLVRFEPDSRVLDLGTGGGFPGIPLAVCCPDVHFVLCDSIGKKLKVVEAVAEAAGLTNVETFYGRAESLPKHSFQYVVSRAVAGLPQLLQWTDDKLTGCPPDKSFGLYCLKGGDLTAELAAVPRGRKVCVTPLSDLLPDAFFEEKKAVYVASPAIRGVGR